MLTYLGPPFLAWLHGKTLNFLFYIQKWEDALYGDAPNV